MEFSFFLKPYFKKKKDIRPKGLGYLFFPPPMTTFGSLDWKMENIKRMKEKQFDCSEIYRVTHLCRLLYKTNFISFA